jgi:hypothetical protein
MTWGSDFREVPQTEKKQRIYARNTTDTLLVQITWVHLVINVHVDSLAEYKVTPGDKYDEVASCSNNIQK